MSPNNMKNKTKEESVFNQFTNQYSLSKTLRFELKPVGNTEQMLLDNGIVEIDKERKDRYEKTKPFFDRLHQEFINESLQNKTLKSLVNYDSFYKNWKEDKNDKNLKIKLESKEKEIREEIVSLFDKKAGEWSERFSEEIKLKKVSHEFLFENAVFAVLQEKYGKDADTIIDGKSIFESWDKWSGYFKKFFETRKNFYKSDGTTTAVATRIVNDNLRRFCENISFYKSLKQSKIDLSELESNYSINLDDIFNLNYYNLCLNQEGIDIFNEIIGGDKGQNKKGVNQYINEYKQKTGEKLSRLKKLDKQIGSDKENFIELIDSDEKLKTNIENFVNYSKDKIKLFDKSVLSLTKAESQNLTGIYFRKEAINTITRRWFRRHEKISASLIESLKSSGYKNVKFDPKSEEYKFPDFVSWESIKFAIEKLANEDEDLWKEFYNNEIKDFNNQNPWQQFLSIFVFEYNNLKSGVDKNKDKTLDVIMSEIETLLDSQKFEQNEQTTEIIKTYFDRILNIYRFAKYFSLEKSRQWNPDGLETDDFYVDYELFYSDAYEQIVKVYDKVRNYLTKKPFSTEKWLLNFENPTLADGWDKNKESDNTAVILRKDGSYYLAVMDKGNNNIFKSVTLATFGYEKMVYKLFPDPSKMMPKVCFSKKGLDFFKPSEEIINIYNNDKFKKGDTFSVESMQKLIDFYKSALTSYEGWLMYDFKKIKNTSEYVDNIGEFYKDVAEGGYKIHFDVIDSEFIETKNNEAKLYLFKIHNKDWNLKDGKNKTGTKNSHTHYFEHVFSAENKNNNFPIKLNGEAELFFRPSTSKEKLGARYDKNGNVVTKNRRYSVNKILFHVPITLNRTSLETKKFNQTINKEIANNPKINIIGIDRGEKHLAYLSVINQKEEILEIKSLNKIKGIDYAKLLEERAKERERARRDWKSVEQIKDLKKGYISNVVREIADFIIKYNAIVVFEDLNMRFKQVRGGIEKSVYQQLEKALIDKLSYLVDKNEINPEKAGHILKAYQLTEPFESFQKMGKQTGILFYTQAEYTSQTDPLTGFRKNLYLSNSATVEKIKDFIKKIDEFGWSEEKKSFYFKYNPKNFVDKKLQKDITAKDWVIFANVPRIKRERKNGYWEAVSVNPNDELVRLFELWNFDQIYAVDMKDQIFQMFEDKRLDGTKEFDGRNRNFWQSFIYLFNLILQLRNSTATQFKKNDEGEVIDIIEGVDFISSPVEPFFCTEGGKYTEGFVNMAGMENKFIGDEDTKKKFKSEFNGDANGAYNIARKGVMILKSITKNPEKPELFIGRSDWDEFTQSKQ